MKGKIFGGMVVAAMFAVGIGNSAFADPGCHPHGRSGFYVGINGVMGSVGFYSGGYAPAYYRPVPPPPPPVVVQVPVYQTGYYRRPHRCHNGYNNGCNNGYNNGYSGNYNNGGNCNNGYNNGCGQGNGYYQSNDYNNGNGYSYNGYR